MKILAGAAEKNVFFFKIFVKNNQNFWLYDQATIGLTALYKRKVLIDSYICDLDVGLYFSLGEAVGEMCLFDT